MEVAAGNPVETTEDALCWQPIRLNNSHSIFPHLAPEVGEDLYRLVLRTPEDSVGPRCLDHQLSLVRLLVRVIDPSEALELTWKMEEESGKCERG